MNANQEELLISVLAGDVAPDDPRVREACARDPHFAEQLAELRGLEQRLSASKPGGLGSLEPVADEERILRGFRLTAHPPRRASWGRWVAVAALFVALLWVGSRFFEGHNERAAPISLSEQRDGYAPVGDCERFDEFRWHDPLPSNGSYTLRVLDASSGALLLEVEELTESSWKPSAEQQAGWPRAITWELSVLDGSRALHGSPRSFSARRR